MSRHVPVVWPIDGGGEPITAPMYDKYTIKLAATDASACIGYSTGTLSLTEGSNVVTGSGTAWKAAHVGMGLIVQGNWDNPYLITARNSDTEINVDKESHPIAGSGLSYEIVLVPGAMYEVMADASCFIKQDNSSATAVDGGTVPKPSWTPFYVYTGKDRVYLAAIILGGSGTVNVYLTRLLAG